MRLDWPRGPQGSLRVWIGGSLLRVRVGRWLLRIRIGIRRLCVRIDARLLLRIRIRRACCRVRIGTRGLRVADWVDWLRVRIRRWLRRRLSVWIGLRRLCVRIRRCLLRIGIWCALPVRIGVRRLRVGVASLPAARTDPARSAHTGWDSSAARRGWSSPVARTDPWSAVRMDSVGLPVRVVGISV